MISFRLSCLRISCEEVCRPFLQIVANAIFLEFCRVLPSCDDQQVHKRGSQHSEPVYITLKLQDSALTGQALHLTLARRNSFGMPVRT